MTLPGQMYTGADFLRLCEQRRRAIVGKVQAPIAMSGSGLPRLPDGWVWSSLSSVCERVSVGHVGPTTEFFSNAEDSIGLIRSQDVRPGRLEAENCARITSKFHAGLKKSQLKGGDILVVRVGANRGDSCVVPYGLGELNCANIIFARPLYPGDFFGFFTRSEFGQYLLLSATTGAAQGVINTQSVAALPVPVPPWVVQERVASILSAYDDLIENNTRRIAILEEMARRIYEEWFIHFRFPGHEGVRMVESELGLVPDGWVAGSVNEVAIIHRGRSYKGAELVEKGGRPFVNLKCMARDGGFRASGLKHYTGDFKQSQIVRTGDMVMGITDMTQERRIVARIGRVSNLDADFGVFSMDLVRVASRGIYPEPYLYAMFRWSSFADEVKQHANGANVLHLLPARIEEFMFVQPIPELAAQFSVLVNPMFSLCDALEKKNANLRATRDLLLPKLISGEIDVSEIPTPESIAA